jgi:hypothetical protein
MARGTVSGGRCGASVVSFPSGLPGQPILQRLLPNVCNAL